MGGLVSLLSRKQPVNDVHGFGGHAMSAARQAMPAAMNATSMAAQQAVPLAKTAGAGVRQGADGAIAWASPYVGTARSWAAPKLEQSAMAINETIAPMISDALLAAAHKIDVSQPRPRRLSKTRLLAGSMLLTAAGAAAALSLRHRHDASHGFSPATAMSGDGESGSAADRADGDFGQSDPGLPDADAYEHPR
jgi:hypothetical protein